MLPSVMGSIGSLRRGGTLAGRRHGRRSRGMFDPEFSAPLLGSFRVAHFLHSAGVGKFRQPFLAPRQFLRDRHTVRNIKGLQSRPALTIVFI
jgi:hypothetical protein